MALIPCSEQKSKTLEAFYTEWAASQEQISADLGKAMLRVIEKLNKTFVETTIFGSTAHAHLLLFTTETNWADWYVAIIATGDEYHIEYKMPKDKQPWKDATVKGATKSLDQFMDYVIIAMTESRAWTGSEELKDLYRKLKEDNTSASA